MTLPTGTVTFLFTDIEGSTKLAQKYLHIWETLRARHHSSLRSAIESHNGYIFQIIGDAFCAAFLTAGDALHAAAEAQMDLQSENWGDVPVKVRMGIHTGKAEIQEDGEYHGYLAMSRVQRLMSAGHGGQVLISAAAQELLLEDIPEDISLRDLGERRLKDLIRPEHIYQLVIPGLPIDFPPLKTLDFYRHNLPTQLTSFIGRKKEMEEIKQAILTHRLVTLTGAGGTGKTRLALQVAADMLDRFPQGVWFVELASINNPDLIPQTILSAFGIPEQPGLTIQGQIMDYLREKKILLVVDNCEHLIQACAELANVLLSNSPALNLMTTSREALGIPGEMIWHVPSLSLPDIQQVPSINNISQFEAVQLFIERVTLVQPHFAVTRDNAPAIAEICYRLDGIPLAIELAAARVRTMGVDQIYKRLDDRFRLLTGGSRTALERHQTLRATIDWSYNLLSQEERDLLCRLSVFSGGWTLEAAEQVCAVNGISSYDMLDLLTHLVEKSLVMMKESATNVRYHMLETTRQYAQAKLFDLEESETLRDRHLAYFLDLAEQADKENHGPNVVEWMDRLDPDHDNFRFALDWCVSTQKTEFALRLLGVLSWLWGGRDYFSEVVNWFHKIQALPDVKDYPALYAKLLNDIGQHSWLGGDFRHTQSVLEESRAIWLKLGSEGEQGLAEALECLGDVAVLAEEDIEKAKSFFEQSFALYQNHGNEWGMATVIFDLGSLAQIQGRYQEAEEQYLKSLAIFQKLGDKWKVAYVLSGLAELARFLGDDERSGIFWQQNLEIFRERGGRFAMAWPFLGLAWLSLHGGDYSKAQVLFRQSLKLSREMGNKELMTLCLIGFASVLEMTGKPSQAARLFGAVEFLREGIARLAPSDQKELDDYLARVRGQLDESTFTIAWNDGRVMTMEEAIAFAIEETNE